jgi:phosphatidylserine/phosphatidylglycerophosphate/cardiolipin synthase-like enzyme
MSRRKNTGLSKQDREMMQAGAKIAAGFWARLSWTFRLVLVGVIFAIILIAGAYYLYSTQPKTEPTPTQVAAQPTTSDEEQAGVIGREDITPVPGASDTKMGSGAATTSDWYELHFTSPEYPTNKANYKGGLDTYLVNLMNKATKTLDVADYDFDLANVADAMVAAKNRGVTVRMVTDTDTYTNKDTSVQAAFTILKNAKIPIVEDNRGPIMHNKFTVVDGQYVETGSWNYTLYDTYRLNNNMIIIHDAKLAQNYTTEFEKMFVQKTFGPNKAKGVPNPVLTIGGVRVQNYFAAEDGVSAHIVDELNKATKSIYFMAFSFTAENIGNAVINKAKAGVTVGGVFETTGSNTEYSEFGKMKKENLPNLQVITDGNPYVMHHKVFIIDEKTVIFGSFNFSDNADTANDENLLIVEDPTMAKAFKAEYDRVLAVAQNPPNKKK